MKTPTNSERAPAMNWFDGLFALLILFPLIVGGFWISRPHMKFELTELAVPTLVVFVVACLARGSASRSWILRKGSDAFERWRTLLSLRPGFALTYATAFISGLWALASLMRHWNLRSNSYDLGIFTNAIWNLTHGYGYVSSIKGGSNLFSDHVSPIFWALTPVFSLLPYPETLLITQAAALSLGAAAVFVIARQYRRDVSMGVAVLPLLYWAYLPIRRANAFDFHPEALMLPLFLWAIAGIQARSRTANLMGWLAFVAALGCKESAGPIAAGIGLAWALGAGPSMRRDCLRGSIAAALGLLTFFVDLKTVPSLLSSDYAYSSLYQHLQLGPAEWIRSLLSPSRLKFLWFTLAPLGFLPLLAPRALVAALPAYLMLFLTEGDARLNPIFHYGIEPAIGLFWASAASLPRVEAASPFRPLFRKISLPLWICFWALLSFGRSEIYWIRRDIPSEHANWVRSQMVRCLQRDTSLTASSPLVPQVATRHWVQNLPDLGPSGRPDDCVWVDDSVNAWPLSPEQRVDWEKELTRQRGYVKFFECGPTRVYQRQSFSGACLRCLPQCPEHG